ncbi:MAG: ABC transporter ATP-binding protein [Candidatus Omnitrophota bacterium]|nr:MAG: ABC transporter ATP-binding protein [Candidatus Omnitrophota bacterium]
MIIIPNFLKKRKVYLNIIWFRRFLHSLDMKLRYMFFPGFLAFCAAFLEGLSIGLLIPTIRGLLEGSYEFVKGIPVLNIIMNTVFSLFGESRAVAFATLTIFIFSAVIFKNLFYYSSSVSVLFLVRRFAHNLRKSMYKRYLSFGKLFFDQMSTGYLYQVLIGFTERIALELRVLQVIMYRLFSLIVCSMLMVVISWRLTLSMIIIFPICYIVLNWIVKKIKISSKHFAEASSDLGKKIVSSLSCMPLIKAYKEEVEESGRFAYASERVRGFQFSIDKKNSLIEPLQEIILVCFILILVGFMALFFATGRESNIAGYMVFFLLLKRATVSVSVLGNAVGSFASIKGQISEVRKIFDDKDKYFIEDGTKEFKGLSRAIELRNLDFTYPKGVMVFSNLNASFDKRKTTAIVGASGAGKTTLINLLMRFYDTEPGSILMDGQDIRDFTLRSLRSKMALVSQESFLFNASLRFNLTYGFANKISDDNLIKIADKARLYDFIKKLPAGLDTEVGDRGVKLSGGEKQRVSIVRAMLKNAEIIILDEATSSLDSITEKLIQEALNDLIKDKTTIVIAHRLSTIEYADKIIILEKGMIIEQGGLRELLDQKGRFYEYWKAQKFY